MGVVLEATQDDRLRPVFRCDICQATIERAGEGNLVWPVGAALAAQPGHDVRWYVVHKGHCDRQLEAALGGRRGYSWQPIGFFIARLCHNARIDVRNETRTIDSLGVWA